MERPLKLFIEVATASKELPLIDGTRIYTLSIQVRMWSLDDSGNIKIVRYGFPIVPDFGRTAHAYCGTTLNACLGDLLEWDRKPSHDGALRGYIIKSRIRDASKLLVTRPYSPDLFAQGEQPGPHMLLKVLLKQMTVAEAKAEWKRIEKKKSQGDERTDGPWLVSMEIPCRRCTDRNEGIEVKKPRAMFLAIGKKTPSDIWNDTLQKGQDLCCLNCCSEMWEKKRTVPIVGCD